MNPIRTRIALPPWVPPAVLVCMLVPVALSQTRPTTAPPPPVAATQAVPAPASAATAPQPPERTLMDWYWAGGVFMHPIALCSIVALAIVVERTTALRRGATAPADFVPGLKQHVRDIHSAGGRETALAFCKLQDHALSRVVAAGIRRAPRGFEAMEKAMEDQGASETLKLRRNMRVLYAIASVATLLGLIGTIQGMIYAFREAEAVGTGKFAPLAKGIYVALVTTFAGLLVAIPVTVAYYFLAGRIERIVSHLNDEAGDFFEHYAAAGEPTRGA